MTEYKIHKSDKSKSESANYQLLEKWYPMAESHTDYYIWRTCGQYMNKKDAVSDMNDFIKRGI